MGMKSLKFEFLVILALSAVAVCGWSQEHSPHSQPKQVGDFKPPSPKEHGFVELYNGHDLTGWTTQGNWLPQTDGSLLIQPRENELGWARFDSYLWTDRTYKDFELTVDCAYPENGNSGIYFRVHDRSNPVNTGIEVQVFDSFKQKLPLNDHTLGGIIPAGIAPTQNMAKRAGEWNRIVIRCVSNRVQVQVNGVEVINANLQYTSIKDRNRPGYIGLQDHGKPHAVRFRNIRIKEIQSANEDENAQVLFKREILPIFEDNCLHCHGEDLQEGDLRLDTLANVLRSGNSGDPTVIIGDDSVKSHLVQLLLTDHEARRMPLDDDPLSDTDIELIRKWIRVTKGWDEAIHAAKPNESNHWSFQPIEKPAVPETAHKNPIDSFVATVLKENKLNFSSQATQRQLIRRVYLVVHGLPPTPKQVSDFLADDQTGKWERLIEQVLASPHYGERIAVNWLDLIRFSETDGFEVNAERKGAWRYRDWVIDAFNQDMPYSQFVKKQLAGAEQLDSIGSAYYVAGPHNVVVEQDKKGQADNVQNETSDLLNATGTTFLGLTLGCARCHNHKFDPITQRDFYAIQAIFSGVNHGVASIAASPQWLTEQQRIKSAIGQAEQLLEPYKRTSTKLAPINAIKNIESFAPTKARFIRFTIAETNGAQGCIDELEVFAGDDNLALSTNGATATSGGDFVHVRHRLSQINDGKYGNLYSWISKEVQGWVQIELPKDAEIDRIVWGRDRTGVIADRLVTNYKIEISVDEKTWTTIGDSQQRRSANDPLVTYAFDTAPEKQRRGTEQVYQSLLSMKNKLKRPSTAYIGTFSQPKPTYRLSRGDAMSPRELVPPNTIGLLGDLALANNASGAERRAAFAKWVVSPTNPLAARVMVNRIWQFHFGNGLVSTPNDFGLNGNPPSHPELLNWLASEFIENGWSVKHIHRLILSSKTWKQASRPNPIAIELDASTRFLWRFPPRRLDAEAIRDSILATTDKLDLSIGGPGFSGFEVGSDYVRHYFPKQKFGPADWRRMVYMTRVRREVESVFGVFDCPEGNQGTPQRTRSTTPLQALNLFNSEFVFEQAEFLAARLKPNDDDNKSIVTQSYQLCFGRKPSSVEADQAMEMIDQIGLIQYCRIMLNSNEFVFIL